MNVDLQGKLALICGASKGIGLGISEMFLENGCTVIMLARDNSLLEAEATRLSEKHGDRIHTVPTDLGETETMLQDVKATLRNLDQTVDILVNNVRGAHPVRVENITAEQMQRSLNRHLIASHELSNLVLPDMKKKQWGRIISILDTVFKSPYPGLGLSIMRATEQSWVKALANEVIRDGVTVNAILPGATDTPGLKQVVETLAEEEQTNPEDYMSNLVESLPINRLAQPQEIAASALFLTSNLSGYITGSSLYVDGGFYPTTN